MKVRIENQRLVFRLNEGEIENLLNNKTVGVSTDFINRSLRFRLNLKEDLDSLSIEDTPDEIIVSMPSEYMDNWGEKTVGFEDDVLLPNNKKLTLIIEKDLKRSKRRNKTD